MIPSILPITNVQKHNQNEAIHTKAARKMISKKKLAIARNAARDQSSSLTSADVNNAAVFRVCSRGPCWEAVSVLRKKSHYSGHGARISSAWIMQFQETALQL